MQNVYLGIVLAPLFGAIIAGLFGRKIGRAGAHWVTIIGVAVSFLLSLVVLQHHVLDGAEPYNGTVYTWMMIEGIRLEVGFLVDNLTAVMITTVSFVSLMVHIYTIGYMHDDDGYQRFFSYIALFTFSMLMLVMANNFLQLFFGWEAVGLVSYLLIGFWFKRESATFAGLKAFLVNRVGDFGFLLGIAAVLMTFNSLDYQDVFAAAPLMAKMTVQIIPGLDWSLMTVICILLFIGAMGKSAQAPLHVWLPDSMEGPTPISALIHAATMVTAGIFMVARMSPLFELSETALSFVLVIGSITALFMGFLGIIQNDIKRVIAYSTLSQLGYMAVALGVSAYSAAIFHLMTHAFFKALLFLGAGSVIIAMHHEQDIRKMGGLWKYMPITWVTFLLGTLALIGTPFFAGFYSKESIISAVHASNLPASGFAYLALVGGVFVTSLYSFRLYFLVFHGPERYDQNPDAHHDDHGHGHDDHGGKPKEQPAVVWVPLLLLAIPSVVIGAMTLKPMILSDFFAKAITVDGARHPAMAALAEEIHGWWAMGLHGLVALPTWLALAAAVLSYYLYIVNPAAPARIKTMFGPVYTLLDNKYYMDWLWIKAITGALRGVGVGLWKGGDAGLIDGAVVNGSWRLVGWSAGALRWLQSGYLYHYALAMILGLFVLMTYFVWLAQ